MKKKIIMIMISIILTASFNIQSFACGKDCINENQDIIKLLQNNNLKNSKVNKVLDLYLKNGYKFRNVKSKFINEKKINNVVRKLKKVLCDNGYDTRSDVNIIIEKTVENILQYSEFNINSENLVKTYQINIIIAETVKNIDQINNLVIITGDCAVSHQINIIIANKVENVNQIILGNIDCKNYIYATQNNLIISTNMRNVFIYNSLFARLK